MEAEPRPEALEKPVGSAVGEHAPYPGTPRWVKVFGAIAVAVAMAFVLLRFTIGAHHG